METRMFEGTPDQLAGFLVKLPKKKRYKLTEVVEDEEPNSPPLPDPQNAASIALLKSWIALAPTDPEEIRAAEEELREFKRNMNLPRKETGARLNG